MEACRVPIDRIRIARPSCPTAPSVAPGLPAKISSSPPPSPRTARPTTGRPSLYRCPAGRTRRAGRQAISSAHPPIAHTVTHSAGSIPYRRASRRPPGQATKIISSSTSSRSTPPNGPSSPGTSPAGPTTRARSAIARPSIPHSKRTTGPPTRTTSSSPPTTVLAANGVGSAKSSSAVAWAAVTGAPPPWFSRTLLTRSRWRLLQRKRPASLSDQGPPASKSTPEPHPSSSSLNYSTPWPLPMIDPEPYWDDPLAHLDAPPSAPSSTHPSSRKSVDVTPPPVQHAQLISQLIDYPAPFHYSSSSLSSALSPQHAAHYEKDADATASNGRQSLLLPTAPVPSDTTSTAVFAPFDYDSSSSSTCALSVGSTSPAPQATYAEDMHQTNIFNNPPHQFHQLQRTVPHTAIQVHSPSVHPVHVDHYTAPVAHEECSLALTARHQPTPQSTSLRAPSAADSYFASSQLPDQQANHVPSPMTSVSLLDKPGTYYHTSPESQLDVNVQHTLLHSSDPLSLSESRPGYHYAHQRDHSRARVVETMHGREQHAEYHHNHVQPDHTRRSHQLSRTPIASTSDTRYALQHPERRNVNTPIQPEAGTSRSTPDYYYASNVSHASQLVRRSTASPRSVGVPYTKRPSLDNEDHPPQSFRPIPRQKIGAASSTKRADPHAPLRLSSDLQATPE